MNDMNIENHMVVGDYYDDHYAVPSRSDIISNQTGENLFHSYDWIDELDKDELKNIVVETVYGAFRNKAELKTDFERLAYVKATLEQYAEQVAETQTCD